MSCIKLLCASALIGIAFCCSIRSQVFASQVVQGVVEREDYRRVGAVTIVFISESTRREHEVKSDSNGNYGVVLPIGKYSLRTTADGFCSQEREGLTVNPGQAININISLVPCENAEFQRTKVNELLIVISGSDQIRGKEPFKRQSVAVSRGKKPQIVSVEYGSRLELEDGSLFNGFNLKDGQKAAARLFLGNTFISASSLHIDRSGRVSAQGSVVFDDGSSRRIFEFLELRASNGRLYIVSTTAPRFGRPLTVSLCDVLENPTRFEWKSIRFTGHLEYFDIVGNPSLSDPRCPGRSFNYLVAPESVHREELYRRINRGMTYFKDELATRGDFTFIGYLVPHPSLGPGPFWGTWPLEGMLKSHSMRIVGLK